MRRAGIAAGVGLALGLVVTALADSQRTRFVFGGGGSTNGAATSPASVATDTITTADGGSWGIGTTNGPSNWFVDGTGTDNATCGTSWSTPCATITQVKSLIFPGGGCRFRHVTNIWLGDSGITDNPRFEGCSDDDSLDPDAGLYIVGAGLVGNTFTSGGSGIEADGGVLTAYTAATGIEPTKVWVLKPDGGEGVQNNTLGGYFFEVQPRDGGTIKRDMILDNENGLDGPLRLFGNTITGPPTVGDPVYITSPASRVTGSWRVSGWTGRRGISITEVWLNSTTGVPFACTGSIASFTRSWIRTTSSSALSLLPGAGTVGPGCNVSLNTTAVISSSNSALLVTAQSIVSPTSTFFWGSGNNQAGISASAPLNITSSSYAARGYGTTGGAVMQFHQNVSGPSTIAAPTRIICQTGAGDSTGLDVRFGVASLVADAGFYSIPSLGSVAVGTSLAHTVAESCGTGFRLRGANASFVGRFASATLNSGCMDAGVCVDVAAGAKWVWDNTLTNNNLTFTNVGTQYLVDRAALTNASLEAFSGQTFSTEPWHTLVSRNSYSTARASWNGSSLTTEGAVNAAVLDSGVALLGYADAGIMVVTGPLTLTSYGDTSGSPGNATSNTCTGKSAIASTASSATITTSCVGTSSNTSVLLTPMSNDATCLAPVASVGTGAFTASCAGVGSTATATTSFYWEVRKR